jgi:riboflavin synthase
MFDSGTGTHAGTGTNKAVSISIQGEKHMFTGIITALGTVTALEKTTRDLKMTITMETLFDNITLGDSIAVNGACLTVTELTANSFSVYLSHETLRCTSFATVEVNTQVNLEASVTLNQRLHGHWVTGHVDGLVKIVGQQKVGDSLAWTLEAPARLQYYIAAKGSVTLEGVSLTVNTVHDNMFSINLIPHTLQHTTLQHKQIGDQLNLEIDIMARYVERLLEKNNVTAV